MSLDCLGAIALPKKALLGAKSIGRSFSRWLSQYVDSKVPWISNLVSLRPYCYAWTPCLFWRPEVRTVEWDLERKCFVYIFCSSHQPLGRHSGIIGYSTDLCLLWQLLSSLRAIVYMSFPIQHLVLLSIPLQPR